MNKAIKRHPPLWGALKFPDSFQSVFKVILSGLVNLFSWKNGFVDEILRVSKLEGDYWFRFPMVPQKCPGTALPFFSAADRLKVFSGRNANPFPIWFSPFFPRWHVQPSFTPDVFPIENVDVPIVMLILWGDRCSQNLRISGEESREKSSHAPLTGYWKACHLMEKKGSKVLFGGFLKKCQVQNSSFL